MDIDIAITDVAAEFAQRLQVLRQRSGRSESYSEDKITLSVTVKCEKVEFNLSYSQGYSGNVKAATLDELLREVARRAGFDDREEGQLQAAGEALRALPAPDGTETGRVPLEG